MKKISIVISLLLSLCCFLLFPSTEEVEESKKDVLEITSLKAVPDVIEGGIIGVSIDLEANLSRREESGFPSIYAVVYQENNQPVKAAVKYSRYNINGMAGCEKTGFISKFPVKLSIPYYVLDLKEGRHKIRVKISSRIRYGIKEAEEVECRGKKSISLDITKPAVRKFQVIVRELRVAEKNLQDNNWDSGGGRSRLPDLRYKVELGSKSSRDIMYASSVVKNSLSAAWIDYSGIVRISEGDTISIVVYDKDAMFDDPMGRIKFKLEELKKVADAGKRIHFGLVNSCLIDIKIAP